MGLLVGEEYGYGLVYFSGGYGVGSWVRGRAGLFPRDTLVCGIVSKRGDVGVLCLWGMTSCVGLLSCLGLAIFM